MLTSSPPKAMSRLLRYCPVAICRPEPPVARRWRRYSRRFHRLAADGYGLATDGYDSEEKPNYRFETVLDFVAPLAALVSLTTLAEGALAGCRKAAWAAANRAIGTRNGLQLT